MKPQRTDDLLTTADSATTATLDRPEGPPVADVSPVVATDTRRVPQVGDHIYIYYEDQFRAIGAEPACNFPIGSERAVIRKVRQPGNPESTVDATIVEEITDRFPAAKRSNLSGSTRGNSQKLKRTWVPMDADREPVWSEPTMRPTVGSEVIVWLPSWAGPAPVIGKVAFHPDDGYDLDLFVTTIDNREVSARRSPGHRMEPLCWGFDPAPEATEPKE